MEAKEFWKLLCEEMDYRFFAGVPCKGLKPLYDSMSPQFMHYIPAVKEDVALALTSGAALTGTKSAVLIKFNRLYNMFDCVSSFNNAYKIPVLILAYGDSDKIELVKTLTTHKIPYRVLRDVRRDLRYVIKRIENSSVPGVAIIEEGVLE